MDDRSRIRELRVANFCGGVVLAAAVVALWAEGACGQSTLRIVGAPERPAAATPRKELPARSVPDWSVYRVASTWPERNGLTQRTENSAPAPRELPTELSTPQPIIAAPAATPDVFEALTEASAPVAPVPTPPSPKTIGLARHQPRPSQPAITPIAAPSIAVRSVLKFTEPTTTVEQSEPTQVFEHSARTEAPRVAAPDESLPVAVDAGAYPTPATDHVPRVVISSERSEPTLVAEPIHVVAPARVTAPPCCENECVVPDTCPYLPTQSGTPAVCGVDCAYGGNGGSWRNARWIPWSLLGPGEYVGPPRPEHVPAYYLRVNDLITLTYIVSRQKQAEPYRIGVGDRLRIESSVDATVDREIEVQPDGEITMPLIGEVPAAGKTVQELREDLVRRFGEIEREPVITVTPLEVSGGLREILNAVTSQSRLSGQAIDLRVTPEGTIQAPGLSSVYVQGLAIEELRTELEARYTAMFGPGLLVSPALSERATSYVFVGGEVASPGRYTLEGPTTVMQAIAMAGGWNNGGNTREVVVFRRDENWCLKATKINVHRPLYGKDPCPVNDVWLRDNDLVLVPKSKILCAADVIELYFTRGVYAVFPITFVKDFSRGTTMAVPVP